MKVDFISFPTSPESPQSDSVHYYRNEFAQRGQNTLRGGHLFCPPRLTGGRPARPATGAPAAGNWFTAAGHLTCPPQKIVIYRGGRYE